MLKRKFKFTENYRTKTNK